MGKLVSSEGRWTYGRLDDDLPTRRAAIPNNGSQGLSLRLRLPRPRGSQARSFRFQRTITLPQLNSKSAICQPSRVGFNRETAPGPGAGFALCAIARAVRRARAKAVGTVFSVPDGQNWTILCRDAAEGLDHCMDCIRRKLLSIHPRI